MLAYEEYLDKASVCAAKLKELRIETRATITARNEVCLKATEHGASFARVAKAIGLTKAGTQMLIERTRRVSSC